VCGGREFGCVVSGSATATAAAVARSSSGDVVANTTSCSRARVVATASWLAGRRASPRARRTTSRSSPWASARPYEEGSTTGTPPLPISSTTASTRVVSAGGFDAVLDGRAELRRRRDHGDRAGALRGSLRRAMTSATTASAWLATSVRRKRDARSGEPAVGSTAGGRRSSCGFAKAMRSSWRCGNASRARPADLPAMHRSRMLARAHRRELAGVATTTADDRGRGRRGLRRARAAGPRRGRPRRTADRAGVPCDRGGRPRTHGARRRGAPAAAARQLVDARRGERRQRGRGGDALRGDANGASARVAPGAPPSSRSRAGSVRTATRSAGRGTARRDARARGCARGRARRVEIGERGDVRVVRGAMEAREGR